MSFLQRLKTKGVRDGKAALQSEAEEIAVDKVSQLKVDVYQTDSLIIIYAQVSGVDIEDIQVSIEGDADIVLLEGKRTRPEHLAFSKEDVPKGDFVANECVWGEFYRRIILPESVVVEEAEAKVKSGVLILSLPLLKPENKKSVKLKVMRGLKKNVSANRKSRISGIKKKPTRRSFG